MAPKRIADFKIVAWMVVPIRSWNKVYLISIENNSHIALDVNKVDDLRSCWLVLPFIYSVTCNKVARHCNAHQRRQTALFSTPVILYWLAESTHQWPFIYYNSWRIRLYGNERINQPTSNPNITTTIDTSANSLNFKYLEYPVFFPVYWVLFQWC